jgi:hypothetical protein
LLVLPCLEPPLGELRYGAGPEYMRCGWALRLDIGNHQGVGGQELLMLDQ